MGPLELLGIAASLSLLVGWRLYATVFAADLALTFTNPVIAALVALSLLAVTFLLLYLSLRILKRIFWRVLAPQ